MDRREMLGESVRTITKIVPHLFGVAGGVGLLLKVREPKLPPADNSCFPEPVSKVETDQIEESKDI